MAGRISVRDVYKRIAVPDNILGLADAMGDKTDRLDLSERRVLRAFARPVERYLLDKIANVSPQSSMVKALAIMEAHNTHYIFLIENGEYKGVVTRMVIANRMLDCYKELEQDRNLPQS
jgi:CBS domain-containing protein